jgi:hypothetical protein
MDATKYKNLRQRDEYIESIEGLLDQLRIKAEQNRREAFSNAESKEILRSKYIAMLGYPLTSYNSNPDVNVKTEVLGEHDDMIVTRCQLEVLPGFWFYGILYEHKESSRTNKNAFVIAQHGGVGSPEVVGGLVLDSANYNHMVKRIISKDITVFAPQLLLWDLPFYGGKEYDRVELDTKLKQFGGSMTSLEVYCIMRCIDYFAGLDWLDESRIGMIGLSYGGMYTLYTAAADTRIKVALSSCWFNDRLKYPWPDCTYFNHANIFLDAEVASLILPRYLCIELGAFDHLFDYKNAEADIKRLTDYAERENCTNSLKTKIFAGIHEMSRLNDGVWFFLEKL